MCANMWRIETKLLSFLTSVLNGVEWSLHAPAALAFGEETPVDTEEEAGWAPEKRKIWFVFDFMQRRWLLFAVVSVTP